ATIESRKIWDSLAPAWNRERAFINERERPVTERIIEALGVRAGDTILELCAGPGEVGLTLAARHPEVRILLTDFALGLGDPASDGGAALHLGAEAGNSAVVRAAGFDNVGCEVVDIMLRFPTFQRYWELTTEVAGPMVQIVKSLSAEERGAVRAQVEAYAAPF